MAKLLSDAKDFIVNNIVLNSEGENQAYGWAIAGYGAFSVGMLGMFSPGTAQVIRVAYKISENLVVQGSDQGYRVWTSHALNREHMMNETIALVVFGGHESRSKTPTRPVRSKCDSPEGSDGDLTKRDIVEASGAIAGSMIGTAAGNALVAAGITGGASSGTAVATLGHL